MALKLIAAAYALFSLLSLAAMGLDKRCARLGRRRIAERTLHLFELLGGWPGSLLGQRLFRHKWRKRSYALVLSLIILLHLGLWGAGLAMNRQ